jgi:sigma-B regulation protein RsbU (phosphoserine phosphatase)
MDDRGVIMIVEDMPEVLDMLTDILADEGYVVVSANNGEQGLALAISDHPDLILLDIHMPGMSGFEVFRKLKSLTDCRDIPVVFLTGSVEMDDRLEGLKMGAVDYLCKPCQREELIARVHTHLELARTRLRLVRQNICLAEVNVKLQEALAAVKALRGLIPICANCKKIRDDAGFWQGVEHYISEHSEAKFSHSMCPQCIKQFFPELDQSTIDAISNER